PNPVAPQASAALLLLFLLVVLLVRLRLLLLALLLVRLRLLLVLLVHHLALLLFLRGGRLGEGRHRQTHAEREGHGHNQGNELSHERVTSFRPAQSQKRLSSRRFKIGGPSLECQGIILPEPARAGPVDRQIPP